jgi:hypothetical protein
MSDLQHTTVQRAIPVRTWLFSLVFGALAGWLAYCADRHYFQYFMAVYGVFFGLYVWVCFFQQQIDARHLLVLGILLRVLLLFSFPNLSDDCWRFLWDGRLSVSGYHPFLHPPNYFIENGITPPGITSEVYGQLNSPRYFTVYPTICQGVFAVAAWVSPTNAWVGVWVMKLFLFICELGTIGLLMSVVQPAHGRSATPAVLYALNPLILLEIMGNAHFEGVMIFFLLGGILLMRRGMTATSGVYWALATASKMLPLLFLPIVWRWLGWRKGLVFFGVFVLCSIVLFLPLLAVLPNIVQSLDLYFREFQFNASFYYLIRAVGYSYIGWDIGERSGPLLGLVTLSGIVMMALFTQRLYEASQARLASVLLFAILLYLSLSAVVQPWYVCVPFVLSLLTRWRFALVWTGLAALSYSHFDGFGRQEHFGLIALEYTVLWCFFGWEVWLFNKKPTYNTIVAGRLRTDGSSTDD